MILPSHELPASVSDWPQAWQERYNERAAIFEHNAGMSRDESEAKAERMARVAYARFGDA